MNIKTTGNRLTIASFLAAALFSTQAMAEWPNANNYKPFNVHNPNYGNFPPLDIDKTLSNADALNEATEEKTSEADASDSVKKSSNDNYTHYSSQTDKQSTTSSASGDCEKTASASRKRYRPHRSSYSPWGNNAGFGMPWGNGSNFSGPWNNNRSGFGMPWGNNMGNNRNGNGFGFSPGRNGNSWSW